MMRMHRTIVTQALTQERLSVVRLPCQNKSLVAFGYVINTDNWSFLRPVNTETSLVEFMSSRKITHYAMLP